MSKADQEILRRRLKERRLFLNMTYQDLADKTGISKSSLQRYETGSIKNIPYDKMFTLSEALEVSPEYFTNLTSIPICSLEKSAVLILPSIRKFLFNSITANGYGVSAENLSSLT